LRSNYLWRNATFSHLTSILLSRILIHFRKPEINQNDGADSFQLLQQNKSNAVVRYADNIKFCQKIDEKLNPVSFRSCLNRKIFNTTLKMTNALEIRSVWKDFEVRLESNTSNRKKIAKPL
jgi:hypothetical protein